MHIISCVAIVMEVTGRRSIYGGCTASYTSCAPPLI
jgi:hypothetical protein